MNTSPNESNNNNEEEPIFVMTLELENGKAEHIKIYADSDPNELAYAFCKDHDLDFSALEYLKVRINDLLQQYKESGDENQIEEVDDEHEGTEDNKNFVYQTNENDSLRYSGEKEENKEGNSNEQVEITDNNNQSEENNNEEKDEDNHQEEEYEEEAQEENEIEDKEEEEEVNEENKGEQLSLKEESNSLKERPMNEEEGTLQDKKELLLDKIEHKEENVNIPDNDKLRREEEIHQLTENNQIDDDIEVQDETPKEEDLHNEQEDLNEDNKPHVDPELEKEEEDMQKSEDITLEKRNDNPIEDNYEKEEDYNKYVFEENQPKELEEDEEEYEEYNSKDNDTTPIKEDNNALSINLPLKSNPKLQTENTDNTIAKQNTNSSPTAQISSAMQTKQNTDQHKIRPTSENKIDTITETHKSVDSNELKQSEEEHPISHQSQSVNLNQCPSTYSQKQPNQSIFDRLFKDAEIKRVIPKRPCHFSNRSSLSRPSRSTTNHNNNISYEGGYQNYGEYLYHKDIKSQKEKMKKNEEDKQRNYNKELGKCTFKPTLTEYNPSSINTANGSKNVNTYSIPPSYRPHTSMSKAEKMQREFDEIYTFHPKINNNANYNVATSFYQRQQMHIQRQNENKIKNENLLNNNNRFKMKRNYSSTNNQSAFDRNYNYANQYRQHKEELYNNINMNNPNMYPQPIKSSTNDIINSVMRESFRNLFKELDSDEDNMISPLNINTKRTPSSIMKIIKPLLDELREDNHILDENDFIDAMTNLYNEINYYDRHLLINTYRTKKTMNYFNKPMVKKPTLYSNYEYKPKINNNATRLAKKYDSRIEKMFDSYMKTYSNNNSSYNGINRSQYFRCDPLKSNESNFTSITNCTFDNYLKNLN